MKLVLFLGAGFSRAAALPTMAEFFPGALNGNALSDDDKQFLRGLRQQAGRAMRVLGGEENDLEHVLSFATMTGAISSGRKRGGGTASARLRKILARVYSQITPDSLQDVRRGLEALLGLSSRREWSHDLTVITTNYDILAEWTLHLLGFQLTVPGDWTAGDDGSTKGVRGLLLPPDFTGRRRTVVCKLHGSLNWFMDKGRWTIPNNLTFLRNIDTGRQFPAPVPLRPTDACETPLIIPPTVLKPDMPKWLQPTWDAATAALADCDRIIVLGYSFPTSDSHMRYFFGAALRDNFDVGSIDIVDPNVEEVTNRLEAARFGASFMNVVEAHRSPWQTLGRLIAP